MPNAGLCPLHPKQAARPHSGLPLPVVTLRRPASTPGARAGEGRMGVRERVCPP